MFKLGDQVYVNFGGVKECGVIVHEYYQDEGYLERTFAVEVAGCVIARYHESQIQLAECA